MRRAPSLRGGHAARAVGLVLGLFLFAAGIVMLLESKLGLSPWDVLNQGLAKHTILSFGLANVTVAFVVLAIAWALRARIGPGTVANAILIGLFIDGLLRVEAVDRLSEGPLLARVALLGGGILTIGVGSAFYIGADYGAGARDSLMLVIAQLSSLRIGAARAALEAAAVAVGFALGGTVGIGTLAFALLIGPAVELAFCALGRSPLAARAERSSIPSWMSVKGLICAGGEATRLGELTRVTNKHLLPVGRWPMIYYPLELLQLAGVREVLIVTGQGHAGQLIDLLGNGTMLRRGGSEPLFDLDLTYKVQVEAGGIAQVVGMAERFAAGDRLVVCLGDNIFEYAEVASIRSFVEGPGGAAVFVKEVPDPERFGVVAYDAEGNVADVVEKAGTVDLRYDEPPSADAIVGLYCYDGAVYERIRTLEPSSRGELEITDVNRWYAEQRQLAVHRVQGWWHDAGTQESLPDIGRLIAETGANKVS